MKERLASTFLLNFAKELKERQALPKNIEISELGPVVMASIFDELDSEIITESIYTGMDVDPDVAVLKGLVEMVERKAYIHGFEQKHQACLTERSDGFAAFPIRGSTEAAKIARTNAYNEAVERYVWAKWWDDTSLAHVQEQVDFSNLKSATGKVLEELNQLVPFKSVIRVIPLVETISGETSPFVSIYFAFLDGGVISGGACGSSNNIETTEFRAVCELFRHGLGIHRMKSKSLVPCTFYEKRLSFFGTTSEGEELVGNRLGKRGTRPVRLPKLSIDSAVPHPLQDLVAVHRCLFENQPPFVGGALERLCL